MPLNNTIPAPPQTPDQGGANPAQAEMSPVIEALKTIQVWIASMGEKDPGKAQAVGQAFQSFVGSLKGGQAPAPEAQGAPAGEETPQEEAKEPPASPKGATPMPEGMGNMGGRRPPARPMPMMAKKGAVPIM